MNHVFTYRSEEDENFPLTMKEIVEAKKADPILIHLFQSNAVLSKGLELQLVENKSCICHEGKLVIPKQLQRHATIWYHHHLQHPKHTRLKETIKAVIYWKGMHITIQSKNKVMQDASIRSSER